jgi:hypothetical protein
MKRSLLSFLLKPPNPLKVWGKMVERDGGTPLETMVSQEVFWSSLESRILEETFNETQWIDALYNPWMFHSMVLGFFILLCLSKYSQQTLVIKRSESGNSLLYTLGERTGKLSLVRDFPRFAQVERRVNTIFLVFALIFLRNVENAI